MATKKAKETKELTMEELIKKMKEELGEEPGATLEKYVLEFANDVDESTYNYMVLPLAQAKFRHDHPEARFVSEVVYHKEGQCAGVRAKVYKGPSEESLVSDGYGEAVANGLTDAPLVSAHHRALNNALKNAGYGVPYWMAYKKIAESNTPEEGLANSDIMAEALEHLAGVETINDGVIPTTATLAEPKKRRGRPAKKAEPTKAVAPEITNVLDIPDDFLPDVEDEVPEMYTPEAKAKQSAWESIPENIDESKIGEYLAMITEDDIKDVKITKGRCANRTIAEIANSPSDRDLLRSYANYTQYKGTKLQLAILKACEIYGC